MRTKGYFGIHFIFTIIFIQAVRNHVGDGFMNRDNVCQKLIGEYQET